MKCNIKTKSNEVEGRTVVVAVNAFGNMDSQGDISVKGSFTKTIDENFKRVKHFLNHDYDKLIGCPIEAREEGGHLVVKSELANTQLANDVLEFYKLYQKNGLTLEHSIGVEAMQRDQQDRRKVLQWKWWEFSTLFSWGANEDTPLLSIKSMLTKEMPKETLDMLVQALKMKFSDKVLVGIDEYRRLVEKEIEGKAEVINCECGTSFDYYQQQERSFADDVMQWYGETLRYLTREVIGDYARQERPRLMQEVRELIADSEGDRIEKGLLEGTRYVRCPNCGRLHYRKEIKEEEKQEGKSIPVVGSGKMSTIQREPQGGAFSFGTIGELLSSKQ
jgi:HK97 family phage prohead protease